MKAKNRFKVLPKSDGQFDQTELRQLMRSSALIGKSDLTRLNWLVRFAERADSIRRLAPEKLDRLADQIRAFARPAGSILFRPEERIEIADALELALFVRDGLRAYANKSSWDFSQSDFVGLGSSLVPGSDRGPWVAPWRSLFMFAVATLASAEIGRLRLCPSQPGFWPCSRLFIKRKSGLYCSKKCSQHERTSRLRGNNDSEEASERRQEASKRRHQAYVQKVLRNAGRKIQVERRPRKDPLPRRPGVLVQAPMLPDIALRGGDSFFSVLIDHRGMKAVVPFPKKRSKRISRAMPTIEADPVVAVQIVGREVYCVTMKQSRMFVMNVSGAKDLRAFELCLKSGFSIQTTSPEELTCRGELRLELGQTVLAEQDFRDAIALAQKVKAKAPESRARTSLARLLDKGAAATSAFDARSDLQRIHRRL
jgi:hypothetical protein